MEFLRMHKYIHPKAPQLPPNTTSRTHIHTRVKTSYNKDKLEKENPSNTDTINPSHTTAGRVTITLVYLR